MSAMVLNRNLATADETIPDDILDAIPVFQGTLFQVERAPVRATPKANPEVTVEAAPAALVEDVRRHMDGWLHAIEANISAATVEAERLRAENEVLKAQRAELERRLGALKALVRTAETM